MTELLERAFAEAAKLPQEAQDLLGKMLLADLEAEARWDDAFAGSQEQLAVLADEALSDWRQGKTKELDEIL
jgi:hypothetical protein